MRGNRLPPGFTHPSEDGKFLSCKGMKPKYLSAFYCEKAIDKLMGKTIRFFLNTKT